MNYYPFHIGDYLSATRHLAWEEDAAYRRLLDICYTTERPLPLDERAVCRLVLATTEPQRQAVLVVLGEFFEKTDAGFVNRRAEAEILAMRDKQQKQRDKANKRWHKPVPEPGTAAALPRHAGGDATAMPPTPAPEPTPTPEPTPAASPGGDGPPKRSSSSSAGAARPADVPEPVWQDFQRLRREKHAPLTDTALAGIRREAGKAGVDLETALAYCCEAGWQGFNAGWYADRQGRARPGAVAAASAMAAHAAPFNRQEALEQRNRSVAAEWAARGDCHAPA